MNNNNAGKKILVTGPSGGIGSSLCEHLAKKGYDLLLAARNLQKLEEQAIYLKNKFGVSVTTAHLDFNRPETETELTGAFFSSGLDGLVLMPPQVSATEECLPENSVWEKIFQESFIAPLGLIRTTIPFLKMRPVAKVVILSGISSAQVLGHYATSNVLRLCWLAEAKTLAFAFGKDRIHFNTLSLGGVMTEKYIERIKRKAKQNGRSFEAQMEQETGNVPLRKYATPQEVAVAIEGLLSEFSNHITGMNMLCDGGFTRGY